MPVLLSRLPAARAAGLVAGALMAASLTVTAMTAAPAAAATATVCHSTHTSIIGPGGSLVFDGQVTTTSGAPVAGVPIVLDKWNGTSWQRHLRRISDSIGKTHYTISPGTTSLYRVRFNGSSTWAACAMPGVTVWLSSDPRVLASAASHNGAPYEWGGAGPDTFDCSGLMAYVFASFGRYLPHNSQMQYDAVRHISTTSLKQGDLVFFGSTATGIYHVGMYAGDGYLWHAPGDGQTVKKEKIWTTEYYAGRV